MYELYKSFEEWAKIFWLDWLWLMNIHQAGVFELRYKLFNMSLATMKNNNIIKISVHNKKLKILF